MRLNVLPNIDRRACARALALFALALTVFFATREARAADNGPAIPATAVIGRSADQRIWQTVTGLNQGGKTVMQTNRYCELGTGICYQKDGQFLDSKEIINVVNGYGVADQGRAQAIFSPSITDSIVVDYSDAEGHRFQSRVLGLIYLDRASGKSVLICETKPSIGQIDPDHQNQITYPDAFDDDIRASVQYVYKYDRFEQNILVLAQLPPPESYGMSSASTLLQVWSEMFDPPEPTFIKTTYAYQEQDPAIRQSFSEPDITDQYLEFGTLQLTRGKAFAIDTDAIRQAGINVDEEVPVYKSWSQTPDLQRHFLIESVEYAVVQPLLNTLPTAALEKKDDPNVRLAAAGNASQPTARRKHSALARPEFLASLPKPPKKKNEDDAKIQLAQAKTGNPPFKAVCLDYSTLLTSTNVTLCGDTTYAISSAVNLSGTNVAEGGVVLKFFTNSTQISITGNGAVLNFLTGPFRPVVCTAKDDDNSGVQISGSTGLPGNKYYAKYAFYFDYSSSGIVSTGSNLRISYATNGIYYSGGSGHLLSHAQFIHCQTAINAFAQGSMNLRNGLIYDSSTAFNLQAGAHGPSTASGENVTVDQVTNLSSLGASCTLSLTNSLLVNVSTNGTYSGSNNASNTLSVNVFQTVGAGGHYLLPGSQYRDSGTTNIDAALLAAIRTRTTLAPTLYDHTNTITIPTTFNPVAQRDTDIPDLGFHYSPIDYELGYFAVTNTTLTISPGTSIGVFGYDGLLLYDNAQLICTGSPTLRTHLCRYYCVQELSTNWANPSNTYTVNFATYNYGSGPPSVQFRFTDFDELSTADRHVYFQGGTWAPSTVTLKDCTFSAGQAEFGGDTTTTLNLQNNLFERVTCSFENYPMVFCYNTLFKNGGVSIYSNNTNNWVFKDNAFDGAAVDYGLTPLTHSNNAYINGSARLTPTNANDVVLSSLAYQSGFLGRYYQPTNSALINAGSRNATNAGLFASTVLVSQVPETNTIVDISYHYIGINLTTGLPFDGDSDGIFDYLEDANQNGVYDPALGETDWQTYNSKYGVGAGPGLVVFTPLK